MNKDQAKNCEIAAVAQPNRKWVLSQAGMRMPASTPASPAFTGNAEQNPDEGGRCASLKQGPDEGGGVPREMLEPVYELHERIIA